MQALYMTNELVGIWNKSVVAYLKSLSWNLPGVTKENNENPGG
jgi:hypothetical protein